MKKFVAAVLPAKKFPRTGLGKWGIMTRKEIIKFLVKLTPASLTVLLELLEMPPYERQGLNTEPAIRASQLVIWAESPTGCGLRELEASINDLLQNFEHKETDIPNRPAPEPFYLHRLEDDRLAQELAKPHNVILIKGPRQSGKTTLLNRALGKVSNRGERYCMIDLQGFTTNQLASLDNLLLAIAQTMDDQLDLPHEESWRPGFPATLNFSRYLKRSVLAPQGPFVLAFNEIDTLFSHSFASEFFSYIRSLHEAESNDPGGQWRKLTFALTHILPITSLYVTELHKSPFNIGTQLVLQDLTLDQVRELNRHYENRLADSEVIDFHQLFGGEAGLVQTGFKEIISKKLSYAMFSQEAVKDGGIFSDHLQRLSRICQEEARLGTAVRSLLKGQVVNDMDVFYRLKISGIVKGDTATEMSLRSRLYEEYLNRHL